MLRDEAVAPTIRRETLGKAAQLVWDFLGLFAELRYAEANRHLASGCRMQFPGGVEFTDCTALPTRSAAIYRWVHKVFERFDELKTPEGTVVYNFGTLRGEWTDGEPFEGVRYIDRFLVRDGKIADQKVWNDLSLAASARTR
jgi:hypothetical protein